MLIWCSRNKYKAANVFFRLFLASLSFLSFISFITQSKEMLLIIAIFFIIFWVDISFWSESFEFILFNCKVHFYEQLNENNIIRFISECSFKLANNLENCSEVKVSSNQFLSSSLHLCPADAHRNFQFCHFIYFWTSNFRVLIKRFSN